MNTIRIYEELVGKTMSNVVDNGEELVFSTIDGESYKFYHCQSCCEHVYIEDICGDLNDLIDSPILIAEQVSYESEPLSEHDESYTWSFYKFATVKGYVDVRWYGRSNGCYSEEVEFMKIENVR